MHNDIFNANDFFLNRNGQPRPILKQNQVGATLGAPVLKDKLFFFTSYQEARQVIGVGSGSLASVIFPPLTNDGSTATLGREFAGQKGQCGGTAVAADGSNINPVALALLNYKLPDRTYLIPSPQTVQGNVGTSVVSIPSRFTEDQALENVDYLISPRNRVGVRCFWPWDPETQSFPLSNVPGAALGFV